MSRLLKQKRGDPKNNFFMEKVAAGTIGDYLVDTYLWTTYPLRQQTFGDITLLDFLKTFGFLESKIYEL